MELFQSKNESFLHVYLLMHFEWNFFEIWEIFGRVEELVGHRNFRNKFIVKDE